MTNIEDTIRRTAQAISLGVDEADVATILINEGASPETAFLQVVAGRLFAETVYDSNRYTAAED